ncbi:restriction endonuclease subunit S [Vibrio aestuarianus]|uniref:restriction endonuclease subunit S n=1 Tax=Vibrio aestuarianus TaxID=28171 RepID=UPI00237CE606|nr:restriction endonuclease subunit S [Vibrio aestuarianus]MDE1350210.1 restriction endonuclease subunit S [Vibrio aestuarianus]
MVPNGWEEKSLKDICKKTISYGIVQTGENIENGVPCVRVVDLSKNTLNPVEMIKTSDEIHQSYKKTILCEGELMMALRGEIGLVKKVTPELVGANITRGLARLSPIKSVDSDYLLWTLRSNKIKNELSRKSGGSALQEIALGSLRKVVLPIPPLPEQRKIAQILSTWDRGIATTEKLIDASKQQKKALMQQLLTGKKRLIDPETGKTFQGDWEEVKIKSLITKHSEKTERSGQYPVLTSSRKGIFFQSDYYNDRDVASEDTTGYNVVPRGFFTYRHMSDDLVFKFNINSLCDRGIVSTLYPVFAAKENIVVPYLLRAILNNGSEFKRFSLSQKQGGSRTYMYLSKLNELKIKIPKLKEQHKIAAVLTAADKEIELLEAKLAHFKQEKKALMQQLLTGKRRVKVTETEAA